MAAETAAAEELQLVQQVKAHRASVELLRGQAEAKARLEEREAEERAKRKAKERQMSEAKKEVAALLGSG